jgi:hypothetical protein
MRAIGEYVPVTGLVLAQEVPESWAGHPRVHVSAAARTGTSFR